MKLTILIAILTLTSCSTSVFVTDSDASRCRSAGPGTPLSFYAESPTNAQLLALRSTVESKAAQEQINKEAEQYLLLTDFYVIRMMDNGLPMPEGMQLLRQQARDRIVRQHL